MPGTLVIPDIHNRFVRAEAFVARLAGRYDRVVFLGDFWDDFGDSPAIAVGTAEWLRDSLKDSRRLHLVGNHDLAYLAPGQFTHCSGFTHDKMRAIAPVLNSLPREQFCAAAEIEGWLISHAGFHPSLAEQRNAGELVDWANHELACVLRGRESALFAAGFARGGREPVGGVTWLDWTYEFRPLVGMHQLLGHTPAETVRVNWMVPGKRHTIERAHRINRVPKDIVSRAATTTTNICLDTHLDCVALIEGGRVTIIGNSLPGGEQVIVAE